MLSYIDTDSPSLILGSSGLAQEIKTCLQPYELPLVFITIVQSWVGITSPTNRVYLSTTEKKGVYYIVAIWEQELWIWA